MSSAKIIENPEVPGLECFLVPPPPPPPPVQSTENSAPPPPPSPPPLPPSPPATATTGTAMAAMTTAATTVTMTMTMTKTTTTTTTTVTASVQKLRPKTVRITAIGPTIMNVANGMMMQPAVVPFPNLPVPTPYILHPAMQPQTPPHPAAPWWIPTDADTPDIYAQWYDTTFKAAAATAPSVAPASAQGLAKTKNKYFKRKNEFIDPAQDAEKVASAQRELSALMKPLKCNLCNAVMNSTLQAKLHYDGRPHQKKVSMFLNQSVKKQKSEDGQVNSTTSDDWQTYCDVCKTWFTSQMDATQHYAGRKHARAMSGGPRVRPAKKSQNKKQASQIDPTGRFGIGITFQPEAQSAVTMSAIPDGTTAVPGSGMRPVYTPPPYPTPLRCDVCGVSANRQDQLDTHKRGAKHLKMLRFKGLPVPDSAFESESTPIMQGPIDYSIYRTPSGQYYCAPCNVSLNSETTFAQHVESKKHKNQMNPKLPSNAVVVAKKARFKKK